MRSIFGLLILPFAIVLPLVGCGDDEEHRAGGEGAVGPTGELELPADPAARVRARTGVTFGAAAQLMPGNLQADHLPSELAPLLLVRGALAGRFGERVEGGVVASKAPVIVHGAMDVVVNGDRLRQFHYHWWHSTAAGEWAAQGVRITVDEEGLPLVWEVLRDPSGLRVLYASERLEARARKRYGAPLPGRALTLERAVRDTPSVVVARTLADGPVPMGPWVYLEHPTDIAALICRCMPSQATGPLERTDYRLRAWETRDGVWTPEAPESPATARLEGQLRWP